MPRKNRTLKGALGGLLGFAALSAVAGLLITATITPALALTSTAASSAISVFNNLPGYLTIDKLMLPTTIYAKNKQTGQDQVMAQFWEQNRTPVKYDQISPLIIDALLSSEDPRYFTHGGIDLIGTARALLSNASGGSSTQGGSSISQQYVKNVLVQRCEATKTDQKEKDACWTQATSSDGVEGYKRKLEEMRYAITLEQKYSKEDILVGYLNIANFGGNTYGIEAAAKRYFGVSAKDVNLEQAALLAGMVQDPNTYRIDHPEWKKNGQATGYKQARDRRDYVLTNMFKGGKIDRATFDTALATPVTPNITDRDSGCAAAADAQYFCQLVKIIVLNNPSFGATADDRMLALNRGGLNIYTTLDWDLQWNNMRNMERNTPPTVNGIDKFGAAIVNVEAGTGRVLSMVQNTRFSEVSSDSGTPGVTSLVYGADQRYGFGTAIGFPAGSTFKVFTLLEWLQEGHSVRERLNGVNRNSWLVGCADNKWKTNSKVGNFANDPGWTGDVVDFTRKSLNSGFFAMGEKLDYCKIGQTAMNLGVYNGNYYVKTNPADAAEYPGASFYLNADGTINYVRDDKGEILKDSNGVPRSAPAALKPIDMTTGNFSLLGSHNVSPLAMANAYATIAAGGRYCDPKFIDRVTDTEGVDHPEMVPATTCKDGAVKPEVAATAAFTMKSVMGSGGSGQDANPGDGTEVFGKTGSHEQSQTWMVESSSRVTTAAWVGNAEGESDLWGVRSNGNLVQNLRYTVARESQQVADKVFPAGPFPQPDNNLTKLQYKDLPNVVGKTPAEAQAALTAAGFASTIGPEVDGSQPAGTIEKQDPGAGSVSVGTTVTLSPSNGKGATVPAVTGRSLKDAKAAITGAGFAVGAESCSEKPGASKDGTVTAQSPDAGAASVKGTPISLTIEKDKCK